MVFARFTYTNAVINAFHNRVYEGITPLELHIIYAPLDIHLLSIIFAHNGLYLACRCYLEMVSLPQWFKHFTINIC